MAWGNEPPKRRSVAGWSSPPRNEVATVPEPQPQKTEASEKKITKPAGGWQNSNLTD